MIHAPIGYVHICKFPSIFQWIMYYKNAIWPRNARWCYIYTLWTATIICPPFNHSISVRSNQRSAFLLTLDLCLDLSRGSTRRPRLKREKEALRNEEWDTDTGKFRCPQPRGAPGLLSPRLRWSSSGQIQFRRQANTGNENSPLSCLSNDLMKEALLQRV